MFRFTPRMTSWLLIAVALVAALALISPQQLPVVVYKLTLISLAAVAAYWLDRKLSPYARPDSYLERDWRHGTEEPEYDADYRVVPGYMQAFCTAQLRRAIIVAGAMVAASVAL